MQFPLEAGVMPPDILRQLAPNGVLRAGINLSNFLLVSGRTPEGDPVGVAPDMARAIAESLGLAVTYVPYANPGLLADAATDNAWDIGLIGAEPQRAEVISFTPAYCAIEATYLVPAGSPLQSIADVDALGVRIAVAERTAFGLWLDRNIRAATLVPAQGLDGSLATFLEQKTDALAGLRPRLISDVKALPGARVLDGQFMAVQQAVGVPKEKQAAVDYLTRFIAAAVSSGLVAELIHKHRVDGLSVA